MKKLKPAYIGIILIFLMFGSTFAYGVIQAVNFPSSQQNQLLPEVPSGVIDYELSAEQQYEILRRGYTIMAYGYNFSCEKCAKERLILNDLVQSRDFGNQVVLQELLSTNAGTLSIRSAYGEEELDGFNTTDVVESLCRLVASPPTECVVFQITKIQGNTTPTNATNSTNSTQ